MKNFSVLKLGLLLAALFVSGVAFAGVDPSHLFAFDWQSAAAGLLLANGPLAITEQIALFDTKRKAAQVNAEAIVQKSVDEGRTLTQEEAEQHAGFAAEVKAVDEHIKLLGDHQKLMLSKAVPVLPDAGRGDGAVDIPGSGPISVRRNLPQGIAFARVVIATCRAQKMMVAPAEIAKQWRDSTPEVETYFKTAVAAGTTSDSAWAGPLVYATNLASEFIEFLRPRTILGRLPGLRRVPFNVRIPRQTSGITGAFVGEGAPIPVQKPQFDSITMTWAKASTIVVLTRELVMNSSPSAEALVRDDLANGISQFLDKRFIDPSYPGVANVSPASVSNGVTSRQAGGATVVAADQDAAYVINQMTSADLPMSGAIWVMSPSEAVRLSLIRNSFGVQVFPDIGMDGGTWYKIPVITSNNVVSSGSPGEEQIFLINQGEILLSDDGQMEIDMSMEASVQMNDAPSAGATSLVSLWQDGLMGVKINRWINWTKRRSQAVQYIEYANRYGS